LVAVGHALAVRILLLLAGLLAATLLLLTGLLPGILILLARLLVRVVLVLVGHARKLLLNDSTGDNRRCQILFREPGKLRKLRYAAPRDRPNGRKPERCPFRAQNAGGEPI